MCHYVFVDLPGHRRYVEPNMEDIPVPTDNTFDVTLPATHSVSIVAFHLDRSSDKSHCCFSLTWMLSFDINGKQLMCFLIFKDKIKLIHNI